MKKIIELIANQGYLIMLLGMAILITGIYFHYRIYRGVSLNFTLAWSVTGVGIFVYIVGRIGVAIKVHQKKRVRN